MRPAIWLPTLAACALWARPARASLEASADPARVVLGMPTQVSVRVKSVGAGAVLHTFASRGMLQPVPSQGQERLFKWTPPQSHVPDNALLAFWTDSDVPEVAAVALPLLGRTDLEADTEPGALVTVEVAGAQFGPVKANHRGRVTVPVEVPPNTQVAKVIAEWGSQQTTKEVKLDVPPSNPLALLFTADPLTSRSKNWLLVLNAETSAPESLGLQFAGATSAVRVTRPGLMLYEVIPDGTPTGVDVRVALKDRPEAHVELHAGVVDPPEPVAPPHVPRLWYPGAELGGFYGGGSTGGIVAAIGLGYPLPLHRVRSWVEIAGGLRSLGFSNFNGPQGAELDASVLAFPVELVGRLRLLGGEPWALDLKLGGGVEAFWVSARGLGAPPQGMSGALPEGFAAMEGVFASGPLELFIQVRGAVTPSINATFGNPLTGGFLLGGVRYFDR